MELCCFRPASSVLDDDEFPVYKKRKYTVIVTVGDRKGAGSNANLFIVLHAENGKQSDETKLDNFLKDDFERGSTNTFTIECRQLDNICRIEIWQDGKGISSDFFVNTIVVTDSKTKASFVFPLLRWLVPNFRYNIQHLDTSLPQNDPFKEQRYIDLREKRTKYQLSIAYEGCYPVTKDVPADEEFSFNDLLHIGELLLTTHIESGLTGLFAGRWDSFDDYKQFFRSNTLRVPDGFDNWEDDVNFGHLRIAGKNSVAIKLCKQIPSKLPVTDEMLKPLLEGFTLSDFISEKRLFIIDYEEFEDLDYETKFDHHPICAPIVLFFVNSAKKLMPLAIQLHQNPSTDNPIFTPLDDKYVWLLAKWWFCRTDNIYHQSFLHLGGTHMLIEGVAVVTHRNLSPSHPIYKLLLPHFLYLLMLNKEGVPVLLNAGGWFEKIFAVKKEFVVKALAKSKSQWRMNVHGILPAELENRGVLDEKILPGYHYRDDALPLYKIIREYVQEYVNLYYDSGKCLILDSEIQDWAKEISKSVDDGGCGWQGVPGDGRLDSLDHLVAILTTVIFTCSVTHAVVNYGVYDECAFVPNSPAYMQGKPPTDKTPLTELDLIECLPDKQTTIDMICASRVLSERTTCSLGNFETSYVFDPKGTVVAERFRRKLNRLSQEYKEKVKHRCPPYKWLDPAIIPNSISS